MCLGHPLRATAFLGADYYVYFKGALQLLINCDGYIRFAQVPERVSTKSFVVLIIGNSKSSHSGAQGTFNVSCSQPPASRHLRSLF